MYANRHGEQTAVEQDEHGREALERLVLRELEHERAEAAVLGLGRYVQRLGEFDATLEVEPASLIDGEQSSTLRKSN